MAAPWEINFAPVQNALGQWQKRQQFAAEQDLARARMAQQDRQWSASNSLARDQFGESKRQFDQNYGLREREMGESKRRFGMSYGLDKSRLELSQADERARRENEFTARAGGVAQMILNDPDPASAAAKWGKLLQSDPRWAKATSAAGLDPSDYKAGASYLIAQARGYKDEPAVSYQKTKEGETVHVLNRQGRKVGEFSSAGGAALPPVDKKAVLEADDLAERSTNAVSMLDQALALNKKANSGWFARGRAAIGNTLPDLAVPDILSSPESSNATAQLENIVLGQALEQLKSTFGSAPTEGERKILIDIQGSLNQPPAVREQIFRRARALALQRAQSNASKADAIRRRTYYNPGGNNATSAPSSAPSIQGNQAQTKQVGGKTYVKINGQWYEQ